MALAAEENRRGISYGQLMAGTTAVSYTHLDVYKRQEVERSEDRIRHGVRDQQRSRLAEAGEAAAMAALGADCGAEGSGGVKIPDLSLIHI